ncbi:MAG: response regulator transcription factor [Flavobacteriaceae bacterium]|nr:response regulator transcription factor [Flavobacteriaceae bacterium]
MNIKVIIVDDHKIFIDGLKSILSKKIGITIIGEANNGLEIIKLLEKGYRPDIIITDIRMPIIDGVSLTKILSKEYPSIPVLALSMHDQSTEVIEMLEAGAKGYLTKAVEINELTQAIHTIAKGEYYFDKNLPKDIRAWFNTEHDSDVKILTRREKEILQLIAKGITTIQMAQQLKISRFTIDTHRKNIHKKLGIKTNTGLVNYALKDL